MDLEAQESTTNIDREYYIYYLAQFNSNKTREYFEKLSDRELLVEYDRLMKLD